MLFPLIFFESATKKKLSSYITKENLDLSMGSLIICLLGIKKRKDNKMVLMVLTYTIIKPL